MMKHREVCAQEIALRREMRATQSIEPGEIRIAEKRCHDEWRAAAAARLNCLAQISTWLPSSTTRLVGRRKNSIGSPESEW